MANTNDKTPIAPINEELELLRKENSELKLQIEQIEVSINAKIQELEAAKATLEADLEAAKKNTKMNPDEVLLAEMEQLRGDLAKSQKQNREQAKKHAEILKNIRETVSHGGAVVIRPQEPVDGSFEAKYRDPKTGQEVIKKVKFQDGHQRVRMSDGEIVSSSALMRIAEGGEATEAEVAAFPALGTIDQEAAANHITDLVKKKYPHLVEA